MDGDDPRLVEVGVGTSAAGPERIGFGCLIADGLVLTAACAAGPEREPGARYFVVRPGLATWYSCAAIRSTAAPDLSSGALLLGVTDPAWSAPRPLPRLRWGELVGRGGWLEGRLAGLAGTRVLVNPAARRATHRWEATVLGWPSDGPPASCAPLMIDDLLVGVAFWAHTDAGPQVTVAPAASIMSEHGLDGPIERATGLRPRLEPAELGGLLLPWSPPEDPRTPSDLLRPEYEVVPFTGRATLLAQLAGWCTTAASVAGILLTGSAGQGKMRLARQLGHQMQASGWVVGVASAQDPRAWHDAVGQLARPLLLIVGDAQDRVEDVAALARHVAERPTGRPVRLLLLARAAGGWWDRLLVALGDVVPAFQPDPVRLPDLRPTGLGRQEEARRAGREFARRLDGVVGGDGQPACRHHPAWLDDGPSASTPPVAASGRPLACHVAALAALLDGHHRLPEDVLTDDEACRWQRAAGTLSPLARTGWPAAVATALLLGECRRTDAVAALRAVAGPGADDDGRERDELAAWIRQLYPPADPRRYWGNWEPQSLREHYLAAALPPQVLDRLLPTLEPPLARRALSVLARAAAADSEVGQRLAGLLSQAIRAHPGSAPAAAEVVVRGAEAGPLVPVLTELAHHRLPVETCLALLQAIPRSAGPLAQVRLLLQRTLIGHYEQAAETDRHVSLPRLAAMLTDHAATLAACGLAGDALGAARQAVGYYRTLADTVRPAAFRPYLAASLLAYADHLPDADRLADNHAGRPAEDDDPAEDGRGPDPSRAVREATDIYRGLAEEDPQRYLPELAKAHRRSARLLLHAGRADAAATALEEAVTCYDTLARTHPAPMLPRLGEALEALAAAQSSAGRITRVATTLERARTVYDALAAHRPRAFLIRLAATLDGLADARFTLGQARPAAALAEQAVAVHLRIAEQDPVGHLPALASATRTLSALLSAAGRPVDALHAAEDAVAHCRRLATAPAAQPQLAAALHTLGIRLGEVRDWHGSVAAAAAAAATYRQLLGQGHEDYLPHLVAALSNLAVGYGELGSSAECLKVALEAEQRARALADRDPEAHTDTLAAASVNLAAAHGRRGRLPDSVAAAEVAVECYRRLAATRPAQFAAELASALSTLSRQLAAAGRAEDAVTAAEHAAATCRNAARDRPELFLPQYAARLHEQAERLAGTHRWSDSVTAADEAAEIYRRLDGERPGAFGAAAAALSLTRSRALAASGPADAAAAADAAADAVARYRDLAADHASTHLKDLARALDNLTTNDSAADSIRALTNAREAVRVHRRLTDIDPQSYLPQLARSLRVLADRLAAAGAPEPALAVATESVELAHRIQDADTGQHQVALSLLTLSRRLAEEGRHQESLAAASEAAQRFRDLAESRPDPPWPDIAAGLENLSLREWTTNLRQRSVVSARKAADIYQWLSADGSAFRPAHARSLATLADRLLYVDGAHQAEAYDVAAAAADLYAALAGEEPDRYRPQLAAAQHLVATVSSYRNRRQIRAAAQDAVSRYRQLAAEDPTYLEPLAESLRTLARGVGWHRREARDALAEARHLEQDIRTGTEQ